MRKKTLLAISLTALLVLGIVGLASCTTTVSPAIYPTSQQQGIWVTGEGKVMATPDIATLQLGIQAQEKTVAQAQSEASDAMNKVMAALIGNGVAQKDIQTQRFSIQQVTNYDPKTQNQIVLGYQVTNIVTAKIRTLDKAGTIIDAAAQAGGDLTRVNSIAFSVEDPTPYYTQARRMAMTDANSKAKQLADLGSVTLGKPTYISETSAAPPPTPMYAVPAPAQTASTPISPGELQITLDVQVAYSISK